MDIHRQNALKWIADNPVAWNLMSCYAIQACEAGQRVGIAMVVERVRWFGVVECRDASGFKINNSHRATFARELMRQNPELHKYFETRVAGDEHAVNPGVL